MLKNFEQAVKGVFSLKTRAASDGHDEDYGNNQGKGNAQELDGENTAASVLSSEGTGEKEVTEETIKNPAAYQQNQYAETPASATTKVETAFITAPTKIQGSIITDSNIEIAGEIQGDIESKNTVTVTGKVYGDIKCKDAEINGASIEGNITVLDMLTIRKDSTITGDLSANNIKIAGNIEGNVVVRFDVEIYKDAFITGEITADSISIENGAIVQGSVNIRSEGTEFDS